MDDHEFPWVKVEGYEMKCTRCGEEGDIQDWIRFLQKHSRCEEQPIERQPQIRTL